MDRIYAGIQGSDKIPGRDFGYAGLAAFGRKPENIVFIVAKSQNDNAVIYEYVNDAAKGPHILTYWLSLEPSARAEHLAKGNPSLISGLNPAEQLGYGVEMETVAGRGGATRYIVNVTAPQLKARRMELLLEPDGTPFLGGTLAGKQVRTLYGYIQMRRGLTAFTALGERAVEEIRMYGTDVAPTSPSYGQTLSEAIRTA